MKKLFTVALLTLALASSAFGTSLIGKMKAPNGNSFNGKVTFTLNAAGAIDTSVTPAQLLAMTQVTFPVVNGRLPANASLVGNDVISPQGTVYLADWYDAFGTRKMSNAYLISGATTDIGAASPSPLTTTNVSVQSLFLPGTLSVSGASTLGSVNGVCVVDGVTHPKTDAGINACLAAVADGGTVFLPQGTYTITGTITVSKGVNLIGAGWGTLLLVAASVGATTDIILIQPAVATTSVLRFQDFEIAAASGTPGRYALHFDASLLGQIQFAIVDHLSLQTLGTTGIAIKMDGTGSGNGVVSVSNFQNNLINGGISIANGGDTMRFINNVLGGAGIGLDVSTGTGASTLIIDGNNITNLGGAIHLGTGIVGAHIHKNEFETTASFTGSNGAVVDIDGTAGSIASEVTIKDNSFQVVNGVTANGLRVNWATRTEIFGNRFGRGAGASKDISITANAANTNIGANEFASGGAITSMIADSGTATSIAMQLIGQMLFNAGSAGAPGISGISDPTTGFIFTSSGVFLSSSGGTFLDLYAANLQRQRSTKILGWSSAFDPNTAGSDTNLSRQAAGILQVGTAETANANGKMAGADWIGPVGATTPAAGSFTTAQASTYERTGVSNSRVFVASDFTTANNTNLQAITGLSWTFPATAAVYSFHCGILYSQATAAVADQFGIQAVTNAPTNIAVQGQVYTNAVGALAAGNLPTLTTTTATAFVGGWTPSATGTVFDATFDGTIELGASANTVQLMVQTSNGADAITIKRGSYCNLF